MTEEVVVNVRGEEISENGNDHLKVKAEHCNGDARGKKKDENGNVGAAVIDGEIVAVDSSASDPIVVASEANGLKDSEVDGEFRVKVTVGEHECVVVVNNNKKENGCKVSNGSAEGTCETTTADVVEPEAESGIVDSQNGSGSAVVSGDKDGVIDSVSNGVEELRGVQNGVSDSSTTTADVVEREAESGIVDSQNGSGSAVVSGDNSGVIDSVANGVEEFRGVQNGVSDREVSESAVDDVIREEVEGVTAQDHELERVEVGSSVDQNCAVEENGICGDVDARKDVVADVGKSDRELEVENVAAVENGTVKSADEIEIPVVVEGVAACSDEVECAVSDVNVVVSDKDHESVVRENGVSEDVELESVGGVNVKVSEHPAEKVECAVSDVNAVVSDKDHESVERENGVSEDVELESVGGGNVKVSEHPAEKVECAVSDVNAVVSDKDHESVERENGVSEDVELESVGGGNVKVSEHPAEKVECAVSDVNAVVSDKDHESVERENGVSEDVELESVVGVAVSEHPAEKGVDVKVSECTEENNVPVDGELGVNLEKPGEESGLDEVLEGDKVGDVAVVSEGEPSVDTCSAVENEDEPNVTGKGEPLINAVKNEAEPSEIAVQGEAESSIDMPDLETGAVEREAEHEVEREAEPLNNAVESEAAPSESGVLGEAGSSVDVPDMKTDAVESESEPLVEAEPSAEGESSKQADEDAPPTHEGSAADALDAESMVTEVVKRPFYYLVRVPRYDDDENIKEKIKIALQQVDEKTKLRDSFRGETQTKKAICKEYGQALRDAIAEERAARDLLKSKRQEMDSLQSTMNRLNTVISVGDIDGKIRNMEHMIQHETLPLKEEKQLIRQIKQLKQNREELSANIGKEDQSQSVENIEDHSKQFQLLRKELDVLRSNVVKTETVTKAARKKYDEECNQLSELMARFKAADDTRQEAYVKLQTLKKQLHEKSKHFWEYKNAATKAHELAAQGKKEELQSFCIDQDERIRELWNNNDEFRRNYVRCNTRSTLRRLQTLDGRSLGPDEEPPVIPSAFNERASKNDSLVSRSTPEQENKSTLTEPVNKKDEPVSKVVVKKTEGSQTTKAKKPAKSAPSKKSAVAVSRRWGDESDEDTREEPVRTKEEEEQILKAEKARKEEEAQKLKEIRRLEEIEKAKEAMQRKKRNAEKAQQRAAYKAQKEAEQKEKEREKRARKKEKKKATSNDEAATITEQDSAPSTEILTRATEELVQSEKPVEVTKRPQKPSQFIKQNKVKALPMAIRNRGKRRIQPWMWVLIAVLVVVILFYVGNNSSLRQSFGF